LEKIKQGQARADAAGSDAAGPVLDLLAKWGADLNAVRRRREELRACLSSDRGGALDDAKSLLAEGREATGERRLELRQRLKSRMRLVLGAVWVLLGEHGNVRTAEIQIELPGGKLRAIHVCWYRRGSQAGVSVGIAGVVGVPGKDEHLAEK